MAPDRHLQPYILHVDMDAFFASVEQLDFPEYRGKPVIVGGFPSDRRSVVSTCSYEARKFGVHSAMPIAQAYRLCPQAVYLRGRMGRYQEKSRQIMDLLREFSPDVRQMSIDEAFVDLTGTERLFGPPENTALTLKRRIFEQTGLTVSAGLAPTKYLAKIASGMSKPDGFFFVRPGCEESFMLSLPLKKIWGIGSKTLERLNAAGLVSAADVHAVSEKALVTLFGESSGSFLYAVVRGLETETFSEHVKSRSISSESTFSFDLTDEYTIETQFMLLSQDVMFRAISENLSAKTAHIKIRYEDFTTVSMQETSREYITTASELHEKVFALFKKKYEAGRGIRLLGVGLQNIEENAARQAELFESKNIKQEKLEKTLVELRKKHPEVGMQKARLLKTSKKKPLLALFFLFTSILFTRFGGQNLHAQISLKELPQAIEKEAPVSLFQFTKDDTAVEFFANGSWESKLTASASFVFEKDKPTRFTFDPIIFSQKTDLSLWFLLNRQWYFEANFIDGYNKNSLAAGYYGSGLIKHVRAGNSGIEFPEYYNSLIGEGDITAPGFMSAFAGEKWTANAAIRYDAARYSEKTFSGNTELDSRIMQLNRWVRGKRFVLPTAEIAADIRDIYVEDDKSSFASYTDSQGRKYRKLQSSEYFILPAQALITLSEAVEGRVAITFFTHRKTELAAILGSGFGTASVPQTGFLGKIQEFFSSGDGERPDISQFSYSDSGTSSGGFFTSISGGAGESLLLLDYPLFSPFEAANRYDFSNAEGTLSVIYQESGANVPELKAVFTADTANLLPNMDANNRQTAYAELYRTGFTAEIAQPPLTQPEARYPAANLAPLAYLQPYSPSLAQTDIVLRAESYVPVVGYQISTGAIPGTIRVYRNGLLDTAYTFKPLTGEIMFYTQPETFDTIRITWLESDSLSQDASLAAALGFTYNILPELRFITSAATRWTFSDRQYSDSSSSMPGTAEFAAEIEWKRENLLLTDKLTASLEIADVTGFYRFLGMEDARPRTIYLLDDCAVPLPAGIIPVLNTKDTAAAPTLSLSGKVPMRADVVSGGNYGIPGYAAELVWEFENGGQWAAQTLDLGTGASELRSARQFTVLMNRTALNGSLLDYKVYLQLGVSAKTDFNYENTASIRTWDISDKISPASSGGLQPVLIELSDADRSLLSVNNNARIVVVSNGASSPANPAGGKLAVGFCVVSGVSFIQTEGRPLVIEQTLPPSSLPPDAARFNKDSVNSVLKVSWDTAPSLGYAEIARYIAPLPLSSYKTLSFYLYVPVSGGQPKITVTFNSRDEYSGLPRPIISREIDSASFTPGEWKKIRVNLPDIDEEDSPTEVIIGIDSASNTGTFYLDEFFLEGVKPQYRLQNTAEFRWKADKTLARAGDFPLIENPYTTIKGSAGISFQNEAPEAGFDVRAEAGITLLKTALSGFIVRDGQKDAVFSSAGHAFKSNWPVVSLAEYYVFNAVNSGTQKKDSAGINATVLGQPLIFLFSSEGSFLNNFRKQNAHIQFEAAFPIAKSLYSLRLDLQADQLRPDNSRAQEYNYGTAWTHMSLVQFSAGFSDAQKRNTSAKLYQSLQLPFASFLPAIQLDAKTQYTSATAITHTDFSSVLFEFPFIIGNNQFRFFWNKGAGAEKPARAGGSYLTDAQSYVQSAGTQTWLYTTAPFADLFMSSISQNMQKAAKTAAVMKGAALLYETLYGFSFQKPAFFSVADLFVPSRVNVRYGKEIRASSSDISEKYRAETSFSMSAYNLFGRYSKKPVFRWYEQDEIIQSYTIGLEYGNDFRKTVKIIGGAAISAQLFFNAQDFLKTENSFQIQGNGDWKLLNSLQINYGGTRSFISSLALLIMPSLAEKKPMKTSRKETLTYSAASGDELYQEISAVHTLTTVINEYVSFSAEAGVQLTIEEKKITLQPLVAISGKLTF